MTPTSPTPAPVPAHKLSAEHARFVELYIANGGNATDAYLTVYPSSGYPAARTGGWRLLTNADIRAVVRARQAEVWESHRIDAQQALDLIALVAKIDPADAFDDEGKLLPIKEWPLELRLCVKKVKTDGTVEFLDPLRARELIAISGGKLKSTVDVNMFDAEKYLTERTNPDGTPAPRDAAPK